MNAKKELLIHICGRGLKCAAIQCHGKTIDFPVGGDFEAFLTELDFEYDDEFGGQVLFGTLWYNDGAYSDRQEYDGSEWWEYFTAPDIPERLTKK